MNTHTNEFPVGDNEFQTDTIVKVASDGPASGWSIEKSDGFSFFIPSHSPVVPTVGMSLVLYGKGFGYEVRGLFLDGQKVFYRTETEHRAQRLIDLYGADSTEWLKRWDKGDSVWSISMGGMGPGYEQAIQIMVAELLRHLLEAKYDMDRLSDVEYGKEVAAKIDEYSFANPVIVRLGLSGAQFGAARYLAIKLYKGPIQLMSDKSLEDRHIQVQKNFPQG